uniref:Uncharacterized protein n=1 Tax=Rhizophora mucronata TaxID=61149 RepID=A0A2P2QCW5_RHIMU
MNLRGLADLFHASSPSPVPRRRRW